MEQLSLYNIKFPVFGITKSYLKIWEEMNVLYIQTNSGTYILDNKNIDGETLGERRLRINNSKLYIPRHTYYNLGQFLRSNDSIFIDKYGTVFKYKKSIFVPLEYYKVKSIYKSEDGECIISIPKINFKYKINCRKAYSINYVGVLKTTFGYVLYEFSDEYKANTRRKI